MRMLTRADRGLTIVELLMAFVLVLLLLLYTISSFVSTHGYLRRGKEYSTALFLSQTRMEKLHATPMSDILSGEDKFAAPFHEYLYRVDLKPWDSDDLQQLSVTVTSPRGAVAHINTLRQKQSFQGIISDPATNKLIYTKPESDKLFSWEERGTNVGGPEATLAQGLPSGGKVGALAGSPGWNFFWAVDQTNNTLLPYRESEANPWGQPVPFPAVRGLGPARLSGIAMDQMGNLVFAADWSNRGLWIHPDGLPGPYANVRFLNGGPIAPTQPPLGIPSGVSVDPTGSLVVIADTENQCLRKLFVNLANPTERPAGYGSDELEAATGVGYWLRQRLRHPQGMGAPQGVAVSYTGWAVYTIDRAYLYQMVEPDPKDYRWSRFALPGELSSAGPSGLAYDEYNNLIFINTKSGEVWKYDIGNRKFTKLPYSGG